MSQATVRIGLASREALRALARESGRPMQAILEQAIEALRRQRFLEGVNAAFAALRANPAQWSGLEAERAQWESTLLDGLRVKEEAVAYRARRKGGPRRKRA